MNILQLHSATFLIIQLLSPEKQTGFMCHALHDYSHELYTTDYNTNYKYI